MSLELSLSSDPGTQDSLLTKSSPDSSPLLPIHLSPTPTGTAETPNGQTWLSDTDVSMSLLPCKLSDVLKLPLLFVLITKSPSKS
jgi:hypothetical protein